MIKSTVNESGARCWRRAQDVYGAEGSQSISEMQSNPKSNSIESIERLKNLFFFSFWCRSLLLKHGTANIDTPTAAINTDQISLFVCLFFCEYFLNGWFDFNISILVGFLMRFCIDLMYNMRILTIFVVEINFAKRFRSFFCKYFVKN